MRSIFLDAALNTAAGDTKDTNDIALFALPLTDQLGGKHAKRFVVSFRMLEDWIDSTEIYPLAIMPGNTENMVD
jgi:hypothetical protein